MADKVTITLNGIPELVTKLKAMGQEMAAKNIVAGAFNANKIVVEAAKEQLLVNDSIDTGLLRDSIIRKRIVYAKDGTVVIITGVNKATKGLDAKGRARIPWRYAHIVEKRKSFMKASFDVVKGNVTTNFINFLEKKIKKYTKG